MPLVVGDLAIRSQTDDPSAGWVVLITGARPSELSSVYSDGFAYTGLFIGPGRTAKKRSGANYYWFGRGVETIGLSSKYLTPIPARRRAYWERLLVRMLLAGKIRRTG